MTKETNNTKLMLNTSKNKSNEFSRLIVDTFNRLQDREATVKELNISTNTFYRAFKIEGIAPNLEVDTTKIKNKIREVLYDRLSVEKICQKHNIPLSKYNSYLTIWRVNEVLKALKLTDGTTLLVSLSNKYKVSLSQMNRLVIKLDKNPNFYDEKYATINFIVEDIKNNQIKQPSKMEFAQLVCKEFNISLARYYKLRKEVEIEKIEKIEKTQPATDDEMMRMFFPWATHLEKKLDKIPEYRGALKDVIDITSDEFLEIRKNEAQ